MLEQRSSLKLKQLQKYFVPAGIDAKLILQAFKIQESRRMLASCRTRQFVVEQKIEEQVSKLDLLQITGRQPFLPQPLRKNSHRRGVKEIKLVLDNPIGRIVDTIAHDPDSRLYQRELTQLKRLSASSPKELHIDRENPQGKGVHSQKDLDTPLFNRMHRQPSTDSPSHSTEYYEQMILNNPVLYRKIMMAYNASKRQLEREQRKATQRRETIYDTRFTIKSNLADLSRQGTDNRKTPSLLSLREFSLTVCLTNRLLVYPQAQMQYKAYICKGNNGLLVKSILKSRPWWSLRSHNEIDTCNLVWTQWKKSKVVHRLPQEEIKKGKKGEPFEVGCHSRKRELVLLAQKRAANFRRMVGAQDELWEKYQRVPQFENYLKFTSKINDPKFEEVGRSVLTGKPYTHRQVQKEQRAHNHLPGCLQMHSKKLLFLNLQQYYIKQGKDVFSVLPLTFHIATGAEDSQFLAFEKQFQASKKGANVWICKPGENSNRGNGITVLDSLADIRTLVGQRCIGGRTVIIQRYMESPLLYHKRKCDLRCYVLLTTVNGVLKGYWYEQGYVRTASKQFSLRHLENRFVHLTNDAVQKKGDDYGKFQNYNKVSFPDFQKYLEAQGIFGFPETIIRMKTIATDLIRSTANKLNPRRREYCFELFGLDFMLDERLNPYLIQANSNPCIQVDGAVLGRVIPTLLENVIRVAIDPVFPPPYAESIKNRYLSNNFFESNRMVLVYDSFIEGDGQEQKSLQHDQQELENEEIQGMPEQE